MFNSLVIGLAFIYLRYSMLANYIQEIIANHSGFRSNIFQRAVFEMLEDENKFVN